MVLLISLQTLTQTIKSIAKNMSNKKNEWAPEEIQLLKSFKDENEQINWKSISKSLSKSGFKRTEQECRHKWVNCLSPEINHGPWSDLELQTLYTQYDKNLSRWSVIQKQLPNRTQIKIKNHFYGVLRNIIRFIMKHFKHIPGRQTETSNKVNPNILKSIYWGQGEFQFLKNEVRNSIALMKYRFNKKKLEAIVGEKLKLYEKLNHKILEQSKIYIKTTDRSLGQKKLKKKQQRVRLTDTTQINKEVGQQMHNINFEDNIKQEEVSIKEVQCKEDMWKNYGYPTYLGNPQMGSFVYFYPPQPYPFPTFQMFYHSQN